MQPCRPDGDPCRPARWRTSRPHAQSSPRSALDAPDCLDVAIAESPRRPVEASPRPHDLVVMSSPPLQPAGHIQHMRSLRKSAPSEYGRWGEQWPSSSIARPSSRDVRVRRTRRPADFGACIGGSSSARSRSIGDPSSPLLASPGGAEGATSSAAASDRCMSVPPSGTPKADASNETAAAKARAIASLQRLFFEEMARGGNDANSAAVAALRRLTEGSAAASSSGPGDMEDVTAMSPFPAHGCPGFSAASSPLVPRRPEAVVGTEHRRRPAPRLRVAVQS